jgi:hypothetical protein
MAYAGIDHVISLLALADGIAMRLAIIRPCGSHYYYNSDVVVVIIEIASAANCHVTKISPPNYSSQFPIKCY